MVSLLACLLIAASSQPWAAVEAKEPAPPRIGLGATAKVGVLVPTNKLGATDVVALEVRERFPMLRRMLGVAVELGYFRSKQSGGGSDATLGGTYSYNVSARALQLAIDGMFFVPARWPVDVYVAVGYTLSFYDVTSRAFNTQTSELSSRHGVRARAGVVWPFLRPLYVAAEMMYQYAGFDYRITGNQNAGAVLANASFGFEF